MTKACNGPHVDNVPGVSYVSDAPPGQIFYPGFDLIEACPGCGIYDNDVEAADALLQHRFGLSFSKDNKYYYVGGKQYTKPRPDPLTTYTLPRSKTELMADTRAIGANGYFAGNRQSYVAWFCSSGKPFIRRHKGRDRVPTISGIIKVSGRVKKPQMLKVPGRRAPGYLSR